MYQVSNSTALLRGHRRLLSRGRDEPRVSRTVVLLGLTSLLTDISSEMVVTVLPLYLVYVGGFSPLAFGVIDGLYNGATALVGLASGFIGDRCAATRRSRPPATASRRSASSLLVAGGTAVSAIGAIVLLDRTGKGIRTAPRDAMISLSTPKDQLGTAFGVHRALDTTGAMLGPLVAFGLLAAGAAGASTRSSSSRFCIALLGVGDPRALRRSRARGATPASRRAARVACAARLRAAAAAALPRAAGAGGALSLATASDAFIFLALQDKLDLGDLAVPAAVRRQRRRPSWCSPCRWAGSPTASAAAGCCSAATRCCSSSTPRCCAPLGGWPLLVVGARAARRVLRGDRRRADGARQRGGPRGGARQRTRAAGHRHQPRAARRLDRVRRAVDGLGARRPRSSASASASSPRRALAALVARPRARSPPVPSRRAIGVFAALVRVVRASAGGGGGRLRACAGRRRPAARARRARADAARAGAAPHDGPLPQPRRPSRQGDARSALAPLADRAGGSRRSRR